MSRLPRKVLVITDAWSPQVNGVVRSIERTVDELHKRGIETALITPSEFRTFPMPGYEEIALSVTGRAAVYRKIEAAAADAIHIATEGPLGLIARRWCLKHKAPFTTAYHTQFPEYLRARLPVPLVWSYAFLRWFHRPATACLVGTPICVICLDSGASPMWSYGRKGWIPNSSIQISARTCPMHRRSSSCRPCCRRERISRRFSSSPCPAPSS